MTPQLIMVKLFEAHKKTSAHTKTYRLTNQAYFSHQQPSIVQHENVKYYCFHPRSAPCYWSCFPSLRLGGTLHQRSKFCVALLDTDAGPLLRTAVFDWMKMFPVDALADISSSLFFFSSLSKVVL